MKQKFLHVTPRFYSFGNALEEILWAYAYSALMGLRLNIIKPYKITQVLGYKICNQEIFNLGAPGQSRIGFKERVYLEGVRFIVMIGFVLKRAISLIRKKAIGSYVSESWNFPVIGQSFFWSDALVKNPELKEKLSKIIEELPPMELRADVRRNCEIALEKYGIAGNKKFVCIHVRDAGFHSDFDRRTYRNANIENYLKAIRLLVDRGYIVFRMGDKGMKPCSIDVSNFIDYPFTSLKSDAMDLYLSLNCAFFIGMQSGILGAAHIFNRPTLTLNMYTWLSVFPLRKRDRGAMKKIYILQEGSRCIRLTMQDHLSMSDYNMLGASTLMPSNISFEEHSSEEVLGYVCRFLDEYEAGFLGINQLRSEYHFNELAYQSLCNPTDKIRSGMIAHGERELQRQLIWGGCAKGLIYLHSDIRRVSRP